MIFPEANGVPIVLKMNKDPSNHASLVKIFNGVGTKVGLSRAQNNVLVQFLFLLIHELLQKNSFSVILVLYLNIGMGCAGAWEIGVSFPGLEKVRGWMNTKLHMRRIWQKPHNQK